QAAEPSQYKLNFPTTGANNLYFDLDIENIDSSTLTWPTVTQGGITATMTPSPTNPNFIRVTLTGPAATKALQDSALPGSVAPASLPQTFVIEGKDSRNKTVLSYGFELKQWFVARPLGVGDVTVDSASSWCSSLGGGYRLPQVKDLTNAVNRRWGWGPSWTPATPPSSDNYADANIGAGFLSEWGNVHFYISSIFVGSTAIAIGDDSTLFIVFFDVGAVHNYSSSRNDLVCVYP
ncbi:hypothetical protein, partial [Gilliamella sp. B3780]